jgi:DHA1 family bicyclomycin/chloramphenicol resistance-like MFS transporter
LRIAPGSFAFTVLLGLFAALPALSIDISAPTLALLPDVLKTSRATAGLTLSLFMAGFALGHLGGGTLSDGRGRRPVLLGALACFSIAGAACAVSVNGWGLAISRLIQGFGAGACAVIAFAMVQDLFEGHTARVKRSYVTVVFVAVPMLAPALGSVLMNLLGWRSVFWVLTAAGGVLLLVTWAGVAESRLTDAGPTVSNKAQGGGRQLWRDTGFVRLSLANGLSYGGIFAYIAGSPVVIIGQMGRSPAVFSTIFASTAAALAAGAWTSGRLSRRGVNAEDLLNPGFIAATAATVVLAAACLLGVTSGAVMIPLLLTILFARGIIAPNVQHLAIERHRERAGVASAAVGVSQLSFGAFASAVVALLLQYLGSSAVAVPMALFAVGAFVAWRGFHRCQPRHMKDSERPNCEV